MSDPIFTPKVSVIMPVYNTELYVERAVVSLMEQTLDDVQFIIIDDGSKDNSLTIIKEIIERYPSRKKQVTLVSCENRGVAMTRSQGIELANGNYIIHLDSDDWAESNWLEMMYSSAIDNNSDVVVCDFSLIFRKKKKISEQKSIDNGFDCIKQLLNGELHGSLWNKMIRRSLLENNKIDFCSNINYLEDLIYVMQVFYHCNKVTRIPFPLINYNCCHAMSITSSISVGKFNEIIQAINFIEEFLSEKYSENLFSTSIVKMRMYFFASSLLQSNLTTFCNIKKKFSFDLKEIFHSNLSLHHKIILIIVKFNSDFISRSTINCFLFFKNMQRIFR
ncbi:glycosyl transferase [Vibrio anguillarum]|uniref:glycosyltransferase family 2 protein n=1 Tax=Vibrio anguillarum TaxID=55601 RepID=UPI000B7BBCBF|nr:glycosyltransferase family A protein [Vibrio anguillarum]ASO27815.1 glycosyl transferase [Vibrio anguillarum]ASO30231.1 glycosyl transferase [Vibrio anguillarum]